MTTLIQWNVNGYYMRYEELEILSKLFNPMVFLLQETHLKTPISSFKNYNSYTRNADIPVGGRGRGGVAILVQDHIGVIEINLPMVPFDVIAVRLLLKQPITLCSIYIPPSLNLNRSDLETLLLQLPPPFLVAGDFNAHGPLWDNGKISADSRGKDIETLLQNFPLYLLNDGSSTHYSTRQSSSAIDLTLCHSRVATDFNWTVYEERCGSDHHPVIIEHLTGTNNRPDTLPKWKIDTANWAVFQQSFPPCNAPVSPSDSINEVLLKVKNFEKTIIDVALQVIGTKTPCRLAPDPTAQGKGPSLARRVPWWTKEVAFEIKTRRKLYNNFYRNPTYENELKLKKQIAVAKKTIKTAKRVCWANFISSLNSNATSQHVWNTIRRIRGRQGRKMSSLIVNGTIVTENNEIADHFAGFFSNKASDDDISLAARSEKRKIELENFNFQGGDSEKYNAPLTLNELSSVLKTTNNSSPGLDRIPYTFLRHLPNDYIIYLLSLYNHMWVNEYIPIGWKEALVIPIPKPGKDRKNIDSYRPISLTSTLIKILEKIANKRLLWYLNKHSLISQIQCGSLQGRSAVDHLVRVSTFIQEGFVERVHTVGVMFDIVSAYDCTWRPLILKKLHDWGLKGPLPVFIKNFLHGRSIRVCYGDAMSPTYPLDNGTPQGSSISCTLFIIAINTVVEYLPPNTLSCLYVDDLGIFCKGKTIEEIQSVLNPVLDSLTAWSLQTGFSFSQEKTVAMHFCRKRCHTEPKLVLNGNVIPLVERHKFLGLTLDKKLTWKDHIMQLRKRSLSAVNILKTVSNHHWGADRKTLLQLYRSLVRSIIDYGSIVYCSATKSLLQSIEVVQNQALRICTGAFKSSPIKSLQVDANEPSLEHRRVKLLLNYSFNVLNNENHPTYHFIATDKHQTKMSHRPRAPKPVYFIFNQIISNAKLNIPKISTLPILRETPPWLLKAPTFEKILYNYNKAKDPSFFAKKLFRAVKLKYPTPTWTHLFTDGSKSDMGVGAAFVVNNETFKFSLLPYISSFSAELYAIQQSLLHILNSGFNKTVIFSDSKSCIDALTDTLTKNDTLNSLHQILNVLTCLNKKVVFCWVPSHVGIKGNDDADTAAKIASTETGPPLPFILKNDIANSVKNLVHNMWQASWDNEVGNKLKTIKPQIQFWESSERENRREEVLLARLRIGHTHYTHGFLMAHDEPPLCPHCQAHVTVAHVLIDCPAYATGRAHFHFLTLDALLQNNAIAITKLFNTLLPLTPYKTSL